MPNVKELTVKIRWTPEAEKWLRDIYDYIVRDNVVLHREL